jgi:hypothetical protein
MTTGRAFWISTLLSHSILLGITALVLSAIALLKKGNQYNQLMRRLMIALLILVLATTLYLLYRSFGFGYPHSSVSYVPV